MPIRIGSLGYTFRRYYVDSFFNHYVAKLKKGSFILDLGGCKIGKRGNFDINGYNLRLLYANLFVNKSPDVQVEASDLSFKSGTFDCVICAEVLEHIYKPDKVLNEIFRVLKPGGSVLLTVPFLYRMHEDPEDFARYTDGYWIRKLKEVGFNSAVIERHGLFFSVLLDFIKQYTQALSPLNPLRVCAKCLLPLFQAMVLKYEQRKKAMDDKFLNSFTTGFGIIATKGLNAE